MFNIIILFTFLLVIFYMYLNKYYNKQLETFMEIMGDCFDNMNGYVEMNYINDKDEPTYELPDYRYTIWKENNT